MPRYWVFTAQRETIGPFTVDELREKIAAGQLTADTQICLEGTETWMRAGEVEEVAALITPRTAPAMQEAATTDAPSQPIHPPTVNSPRVDAGKNLIPTLTFMQGFKQSVRNYGRFRGRSRRSELWWGGLAGLILLFFAMIPVILAVVLASRISDTAAAITGVVLYLTLIGAWGIPWGMSLCVRRLHDIGKSGWWYVLLTLLGFVPFVGVIGSVILIVWYCTDSEPGDNRWGPNPKIAIDPPSAASTST